MLDQTRIIHIYYSRHDFDSISCLRIRTDFKLSKYNLFHLKLYSLNLLAMNEFQCLKLFQ